MGDNLIYIVVPACIVLAYMRVLSPRLVPNVLVFGAVVALVAWLDTDGNAIGARVMVTSGAIATFLVLACVGAWLAPRLGIDLRRDQD